MRWFALLVIIFIAGIETTYSQDQWVIEITVSGYPSGCQWTTSSGSFSSSFMGFSGGQNLRITMPNGNFSGTISGSGSQTCNCTMGNGQQDPTCTSFTGSASGSVAVTHTEADGEGCVTGGASFGNSQFSGYIGYTIYKILNKPDVTAAPGGCGSVTLATTSTAGSYAWQVTDNPAIGSHWQWLSGKTTQSIVVSASDLNLSGFTGSIRYVRVTAGECDKRMSFVSDGFTILLPPPTSASLSWGAINCYGGDGNVKINSVSGSVTNYTYTLRFKDVSNTFGNIYQGNKANSSLPFTIDKTITQPAGTPMKAGDYELEIANNVNVSVYGACSRKFTRTITQPTEITPTITASDFNGYGTKCKGDASGSLSVSVTGGTPGYSYSWSSGSTSNVASGLTANNYSVTITDSKSCTKSASKSLTEPLMLSAAVAVDRTPSCDDSPDGQLSVTVSSGTGVSPYSYSWTSGSTSTAAPNLLKGDYTVTVTDKNGCQLPVVKTLPGPSPVIVTLSTVSPNCAGLPDGGKVWVSDVQNGIAPYQYLWNTNDNSDQLVNVPAGNYNVQVSFVNNGFTCKGIGLATIVDPIPWTAQIVPFQQYHGSTISCSGESDGRLDVVVKNDLGQVTNGEFYAWSTNENGTGKTFIDELSEGNYNVSVRYNNTCQAKASYSLLAPLPVKVEISADTDYHGQVISCHDGHDGAVTVTASDGTGLPSDFTYLWNTGASSTYIAGLSAGTYTVNVKDVNQCPGSNYIIIDNPEEVTASISLFSDYTGFGISCNGRADGFINAEAGGGTKVYSYSWTNGNNTASVSEVGPGDYTITIADNNGCSATASHTITVPDVLTLQVAGKKDVSCFNGKDGSIVLLANGGALPYQFSKDNVVFQEETDFNTLPIGTYTLNVVDANGCANNVIQALEQPDQLHIFFTDVEPAFCADPRGKATGVVIGGVGDYQYEWRNSEESKVVSTTTLLANVPAGVYTLSILDEHNCTASASTPITSTDGAKTTYTSTAAKCSYSEDGSAMVEITEGEGPFKVRWPDNQSTLKAVNLKGGTYNVLITDARLCTVVQTVMIDAPDAIQLNVKDQTIPTCNGLCDGNITLEALGGSSNYTYAWNGSSGAKQSNLCAGAYGVVVQDGNGCVLNKEIELKQPDILKADLVKETLPTCNNGCNGILEVLASGGNGNYNYAWTSAGTTSILRDICPADYDVVITDRKGCMAEATFTLHNTPKPVFNLGGGVTLCVGQKYTLDAGSQWKYVQWGSNDGLAESSQSIVVSKDGTYWADVVSKEGCAARDTFLLQTSRDLLRAEFFMASMANVGDTVVIVDVSWPLPDAIEWSFPTEMKKLYDNNGMVLGQFNNQGDYNVLLTAHLGECVDEMQKTITILEEMDNSDGGRLGYEKFVKKFTMHPNPNDGKFDVSIEFASESPVIISVWNVTDLKMIGKIVDDNRSSYEEQIDLRPLPAGNYLLRLDHANGKEFIRFIVE